MTAILERIQETWLSQAISGSVWGYPVIGAVHVLGMALFGGGVLVSNLRLLGFVFERETYKDLATQLRALKLAGLAVVLATGVLLFISRPLRYYDSTSFRVKVALLLLLAAIAVWCARYEREGDDGRPAPAGAKLAAYLSLTLWIAVIFAARGTAFF